MAEAPETGGISFSANKPLIPNGKLPSGRGASTATLADGKIVVFGGHYLDGPGKYAYMDETWLLDVDRLTWHKMPCTGQIPGPRYGHCAHIFGSRMFIFGGKGPDDTVYKDIYFLDLIEWIWVPVNPISRGPTPRYAFLWVLGFNLKNSFVFRFFFASEIVGRKIVLQGGWDGNEVFSDFWIFNTDSFAWLQPRTTGFAPTPRYGHSITLTPDGRLLVIGGCTISKETGFLPRYNDDIRQLNTETMVWSRPRINGHCPTGRYGHSAVLLGRDRTMLVLFGGWGKGGCQGAEHVSDTRAHSMQVLDTREMIWYVPRKLSKKPLRHLYNHGACAAGSSSMLMFGGFDGRQAANDFIVTNFDFGEI